jgi:hypothetical protein
VAYYVITALLPCCWASRRLGIVVTQKYEKVRAKGAQPIAAQTILKKLLKRRFPSRWRTCISRSTNLTGPTYDDFL